MPLINYSIGILFGWLLCLWFRKDSSVLVFRDDELVHKIHVKAGRTVVIREHSDNSLDSIES